MDTQQFEGRKRDHIRHALDPAHQATGSSGLERIHLFHEALPDLNLKDIRLDSICLGRRAPTPFFVAGMTAGHADAVHINRTLALACAERGWAMGVGSQRRELNDPGARLDEWKGLRSEAPRLRLFANLGISQLVGVSIQRLQDLVGSLEAQALAVHANPLQESIQPEGTPSFRGCVEALQRVCEELGSPVVLKETGCGFSRATLLRLKNLRLSAIDVSGFGGTHWGRIEGARADKGSKHAAAAATFADWGESTVESVLNVKAVMPNSEIWASGGVRSGLDAAKLIALGAHCIGYAKPALEAAIEGPQALLRWMEIQEYELKVALFCTGTEAPLGLRQKENAWKASGT